MVERFRLGLEVARERRGATLTLISEPVAEEGRTGAKSEADEKERRKVDRRIVM